MIVTLTLNPAIDRTVVLEHFDTNAVNHVKNTQRDAAGKGINVGKVLDRLGFEPLLTGFLAGQNGEFIKDNLHTLMLNHHFIQVPGETRENLKIWPEDTRQMIEINDVGPSFNEDAYDRLERYLEDRLTSGDWLVLSGSLPKNSPQDLYARLIRRCHVRGVKTVLDASNVALAEGLKAHPTVLKPNRQELESLAGHTLPSLKDIQAFLEDERFQKVEEIYVTLGHQGALAKQANALIFAQPLTLETKSTVGAGDAFVAGIMVAKAKGYGFEDTLRYASATASAATQTEGTNPPSPYDIQTLFRDIELSLEKEGIL